MVDSVQDFIDVLRTAAREDGKLAAVLLAILFPPIALKKSMEWDDE
jgi:hypothetical protein